MIRAVTLSQFILRQQHEHPEATGEFTSILMDIELASKEVWRLVARAGLADVTGHTGDRNVHGELVAKLDILARDIIVDKLGSTGQVGVMASEEDHDIILPPQGVPLGKYVVNFDPLDGSSNIDVGVNVGTIFSILPRVTTVGKKGTSEDCLQPGRRQLCAGYVMYGSSTVLVFTTGNGVHGFTFDPTAGEFFLTHPSIKIPAHGRIYSVNEGNYGLWDRRMQRFADWLREKRYSLRYIGTLVGDLHRTLLHGGVFMYPGDQKHKQGKLRLLYECNPIALIVEQAGGRATDGQRPILDIIPTSLHQRTPIFFGGESNLSEWEGLDLIQGLYDGPLSTRELEVARLITEGMANKEIASALNISERTVKKHVTHICTKSNLRDRLQIGVHFARQPHLLERPARNDRGVRRNPSRADG